MALSTTADDANSASKEKFATGTLTAYLGVRVWVVHADATTAEITAGSPVAVLTMAGVDGGWVERDATWDCPETVLVATDSIRVTVYAKLGTGAWASQVSFTSEQLGTTILNAATWTVHYTTMRWTSGVPTKTYIDYGYGYDNWFGGGGVAVSRITNFTYGVAASNILRRLLVGVGL